MQKIDFVKNLETIVVKLQSEKVVKEFLAGFSNPQNNYAYQNINPLLFTSKSNYDQIKMDESYSPILNSLNAETIYTEANLSSLTTILRFGVASSIIPSPSAIALYTFHDALLKTLKLSKGILIDSVLNEGFESAMNNGIIVFQILIEGEGLETERYIKIFSAFQELIETISKIVNETGIKSEVVLLDSGSDTNIGLKTGVETAKSLFLIFKEIWDFITNFRFYKQTQQNRALLESLTIREEIKKRVAEGLLSDKEGLEYTHMIKTRTDDLIGMKVLPKQIVIETNQIDNKKLLSEFEGLRLLTSGE